MTKAEMHASQKGLCWLCDMEMTLQDASYDHLLPASKGGTWHSANLRLAHKACNSIRGNIPAPLAREYVQGRLAGLIERAPTDRGPKQVKDKDSAGWWLRQYLEQRKLTKPARKALMQSFSEFPE